MPAENDLVGMLIANPAAFYGLSLLMIFLLGSMVFWMARKRPL
jgi:hypothetical protein